MLWSIGKLSKTSSTALCRTQRFEQSTAEIENDSPSNATNGLKSTKSFPDFFIESKEEDINQDRQRNL